MKFHNWLSWISLLVISLKEAIGADDSYNTIQKDGSYEFGYNNPDSYHFADANRNNVVKGEFGGRNPGTGAFDSTVYTAGPRGFRPRGKNVVRKYDLNQSGPRPVGSPDDPLADPYEDPSYSFSFRTRTYTRQEDANRAGDVNGRYSYVDDVGERHNVEFVAGKNTGFHVKTPFPDSNPRAYGPLYFNGRGKPIPRGRTSIQRGLDGSYRFVSAGPDQRRTETSDATGHVRGSYTYLDDKGVQHSVHYIAGPETGYRVLKTVKGPHLPTVFPFGRPEIIPPDFYDYGKDRDVFDTAASGHIKPGSKPSGARPIGGRPTGQTPSGGISSGETPSGGRPFGGTPTDTKPTSKEDDFNKDKDQDEFTFGNKKPVRPSDRPTFDRPSYADEDTDDFGDLFGGSGASTGSVGRPGGAAGTTARPSRPPPGSLPTKPGISSGEDDGSYKPSSDDGSYKPRPTKPAFGNLPRPGGLGTTDDGAYRPTPTKPAAPTKPSLGDLPRPGGLGSTTSTLTPSTVLGVKPSGFPAGSGLGTDYGDGGDGPGKPGVGGEGSNEVGADFGLFGSETGNARPPFGVRPVIHVGTTDESCKRCAGTIVTNVGDKLFTVPPGVSVRAHVQAIDLVPISPSVPSPSEQYKAETGIRTDQLNESSSQVVSTNTTEDKNEKTSTETTVTTTIVPNT